NWYHNLEATISPESRGVLRLSSTDWPACRRALRVRTLDHVSARAASIATAILPVHRVEAPGVMPRRRSSADLVIANKKVGSARGQVSTWRFRARPRLRPFAATPTMPKRHAALYSYSAALSSGAGPARN